MFISPSPVNQMASDSATPKVGIILRPTRLSEGFTFITLVQSCFAVADRLANRSFFESCLGIGPFQDVAKLSTGLCIRFQSCVPPRRALAMTAPKTIFYATTLRDRHADPNFFETQASRIPNRRYFLQAAKLGQSGCASCPSPPPPVASGYPHGNKFVLYHIFLPVKNTIFYSRGVYMWRTKYGSSVCNDMLAFAPSCGRILKGYCLPATELGFVPCVYLPRPVRDSSLAERILSV